MNPLERHVWLANHRSGKMKGGFFNDFVGQPTIGSRLSYLFGRENYGNYPDIQTLWEQYNNALDPEVRKELIARIQKLIYDRTMVIPLFRASVPTIIGSRVKGNIFNFRKPPLWFPGPLEDLELNK